MCSVAGEYATLCSIIFGVSVAVLLGLDVPDTLRPKILPRLLQQLALGTGSLAAFLVLIAWVACWSKLASKLVEGFENAYPACTTSADRPQPKLGLYCVLATVVLFAVAAMWARKREAAARDGADAAAAAAREQELTVRVDNAMRTATQA